MKSLSDGSCLFSSASIAITGDNRFVTELRVRTCVEMVTNHEIYKALPNAPDLLDTSPSFDESMNNILKLSTNWKTCKLPELVEKLHKIVQLQYRDIRRALYGEGNYAMAPWTRKFQVSHVAWSTKSAEEKDALMKKFQRFTFRKEKEISSSDGNLKIPKTPTTARKPNQKKRIRSTKTTTIKFE